MNKTTSAKYKVYRLVQMSGYPECFERKFKISYARIQNQDVC